MDLNYILYDDSSDSENYAPLQSSQSGPIVTITASPPRADLEEYYYMEDHTEYNIHDSDYDQEPEESDILGDFTTMSLENNMTINSPQTDESSITIETSGQTGPTEVIFPHQPLSDIIHTIPANNEAILLIWGQTVSGWRVLRGAGQVTIAGENHGTSLPRENLSQYGYICRVSETINQYLHPDETAYTLWSHLSEDWRRALHGIINNFYVPTNRQEFWDATDSRED